MEGRFDFRIYYEDTDCLGIVYYANYMRFLERGRTEFFEEVSRPLADWNAAGYKFAVYKLEVTFRTPAKLGDRCHVLTRVGPQSSRFRLRMQQSVRRGDELLVEATVHIVCLDTTLKVRSMPAALKHLWQGSNGNPSGQARALRTPHTTARVPHDQPL